MTTLRSGGRPRSLWLAVISFSCFVSPLLAQQITGSVTGSVTDPSGAIMVGIGVTLTNTATSEVQTAQTDTAGDFRFLSLPPSTYVIEVSSRGFKTFRREGIIVEADRSLAVPVTLSIGQSSETVEVVGGTPLLEPNTSEVGSTIDNQKVMELPLN